jgi:protein gp37
MGRETKIAWANHTFNGARGCEHATLADGTESPGCAHCYAEGMSKRNPATLGKWGPEGTRILGGPDYWGNLDRWHRAAVADAEMRRVFCYSLGDVFESPRNLANADVCAKGRTLLFDAIERLQPRMRLAGIVADSLWQRPTIQCGLIFLLLTKRPENVKRMVPTTWLVTGAPSGSALGWPRHVWLGTSVENQQAADERIPDLLDVPGVPVRFLSIEPLLERIDVRRWLRRYSDGSPMCGYCCNKYPQDGPCDCFYRPECPRCKGSGRAPACIGWGIAGGESDGIHGKRARPCDLAWIRDLRDQLRAAAVPFFNKQLGANAISTTPGERGSIGPRIRGQGWRVRLKHPKGEDPSEWPEDLRVREVPEVRL